MKYNIDKITEDALDAFWAVVAKNVPDATTGDFPPDATISMEREMRNLIEMWMRYNCRPPLPTVGQRVKLVRGVDRLPDFYAEKELTGTVQSVREEMIIVKMDAPLAGSEQWDNCIEWTDNDLTNPVLEFWLDVESL